MSVSKVAFVTGTSSGFGAAIARQFAKDAMRVVATARRIEKVAALQQEFGDLILPAALDVRDRLQVESVVAGLPSEFAAIDVLVNNAGLSLNLEPAYRVPIEDWEAMVDTNLKRAPLLHPAYTSRHGHARPRPRGEYRIGGRHVPLPRRKRLRSHESLRETVFA